MSSNGTVQNGEKSRRVLVVASDHLLFFFSVLTSFLVREIPFVDCDGDELVVDESFPFGRERKKEVRKEVK